MKEEIETLEKEMVEPTFWDDQERAQKVVKRANFLKKKVKTAEDLDREIEEVELFCEMALEESDPSVTADVEATVKDLTKRMEKLRLETLLSGEYDTHNCILSIHAGTGGTDAMDWASMLFRMYKRYAQHAGFSVDVLDYLDGEAGIKSVTLRIHGDYAYGFLKSEKGVHRLVRLSPFDSSGKRHTSFASVDVMPELEDEDEVDIKESDLKIDTYRASGAGGQHINTTDSAVRITHMPTGVVVQCQNERSQIANRATAMKMLMAKLIELKQMEQKEKIEDLQGNYSEIAWGSQIRSYVFHPYTMVKDHRTNAEVGNINAVMDGEIDPFIDAYLKQKA